MSPALYLVIHPVIPWRKSIALTAPVEKKTGHRLTVLIEHQRLCPPTTTRRRDGWTPNTTTRGGGCDPTSESISVSASTAALPPSAEITANAPQGQPADSLPGAHHVPKAEGATTMRSRPK